MDTKEKTRHISRFFHEERDRMGKSQWVRSSTIPILEQADVAPADPPFFPDGPDAGLIGLLSSPGGLPVPSDDARAYRQAWDMVAWEDGVENGDRLASAYEGLAWE